MQRQRILWRILLQAMVAGLLFVAINNVRVPEEVTAAPADPCIVSGQSSQRPCDTTTSSVAVTTTTAPVGEPTSSTSSVVTTTTVAPGNSGGQGNSGGSGTTTTTTLPDGTTTTTTQPGNSGGQGNSGGGQGNPGGTTTTTTTTSTTTTTTTPPITVPPTVDTLPPTSSVPAVVETVPTSSTVPAVVEETTTTSIIPVVVETIPTTSEPIVVRRSTSTTGLPQVEASVTTVFEPSANNFSELRIEGSDGEPYLVTVVYSLNEGGQPEAELRVSDRMTKIAADLGFVTVRLVAVSPAQDSVERTTEITKVRFLVPLIEVGEIASTKENLWDSVTHLKSKVFERATEIRFGLLPANGIVAMSSDEIVWDELPRLVSKSLSADQQVGYFVDSDAAVTILTKRTGSFGIRQKRESLSIEQWSAQMTPGSATKLQIEGDVGEDQIEIIVGDSGSVCQVSSVGILTAVGSGVCYVTAIQGGGSMYMSSVAETRMTEVSLLGQIRDVVVEYHTSLSMLALVILLALILLWQFFQTVMQIRMALRTDPGTL